MKVLARQNESLDALVWRLLGSGAAAVEATLLANRDLAPLAQALPENHPVALPDIAPPPGEIDLVQLWD